MDGMNEVTPACDVCDTPQPLVYDWCGECGCCANHCQQHAGCPPHTVNLAEPPEFLRNVIEFDDEQVVGFAPITELCADGLSRPYSYMLITVRGIYYFNPDGICYRAKALHTTITTTGVRPHWQRDVRCTTCGDTGEWTSTTEESPTVPVSLGECPDCKEN